jgi:endonuclease-8
MPEGHTIHRLAADHRERFGARVVRASSPQGKFSDSAALLDGQVLVSAEAHGKHLFLGFRPAGAAGSDPGGTEDLASGPGSGPGGAEWVHIHLGLIGKVTFGDGPPPPATGTVRLRLANGAHWADLRGPAACELITDPEKRAIHDRLGPDPLRPDDDAEGVWRRLSRSRISVAALLLDQKVIAGVGNVYRAEVLFRHGVDPLLPGRELPRERWDAMWADLVTLMREGVRTNRIDTVRPEHTPEAMGRPPRVDDHGGEVYVYRRTGQPCLLCGTEIRTRPLAARNLFWCPECQPAHSTGD